MCDMLKNCSVGSKAQVNSLVAIKVGSRVRRRDGGGVAGTRYNVWSVLERAAVVLYVAPCPVVSGRLVTRYFKYNHFIILINPMKIYILK